MGVDIQNAFDKASGEKTPWNPSRRAIARVSNPLPAPTSCPYCASAVELVNNSVIYGRPFGEWPWAYLCENVKCGAYVGIHPFTAIPLGTLANKELRDARKRAKVAFNPIWQGKRAKMNRKEAYSWLADELGIRDVGTCHIGWFDIDMCGRVVTVCKG